MKAPVITKEKFDEFNRVRDSGETNMYDVLAVVMLSDCLNESDVKAIISNYDAFKEKFYPKEAE